jgi:transposase
MKSLLETRPIYHQNDETIRGHVFCSFLALVVRQELERRLEQHGWAFEWADIVRDLDHLAETTITVAEKPYVIRSEIKGTLGKVFQAAGVAIPPALRPA